MKIPWLKICVCVLLWAKLTPSALASRFEMSQREGWKNPDVSIIKGIIDNSRYDNRTAYYTVDVLDILKFKVEPIPKTIMIVDPHYASSAMVHLKEKENVVLFVKKEENGGYQSYREIHLDLPSGPDTLSGLKLFLKLMFIDDKAKQHQECLKAWQPELSDVEKKAVLDAMWETRCSDYIDLLIDTAKGQDSSRLRSWAVTILAYVDKSPRSAELIGLLDDPDYDVRRQALVFFGAHKVKEAILGIEKLLKEDINAKSESQTNALRKKAREALDKITGKNTSPYWKN